MASSSSQGGRLPTGFQEVAWLEGNGTQYCVTNYCPQFNVNEKTVIKGDVTVTGQSVPYFDILATWVNGSTAVGYGVIISNNAFHFYDGYTSDANVQIETTPIDFHYELNVSNYILNNTSLNKTDRTVNNTTYPFIIGARNVNGSITVYNKGVRIKAFSIYNADQLLTEIIPCYRASDNVAGFYETGTQAFLTNQGSGADWIIGPTV